MPVSPRLSRTARLCLLGRAGLMLAIAAPVTASAEDWTPLERAWLAAQQGAAVSIAAPPRAGSIDDSLAAWRDLSKRRDADFTEVSSFLLANPDWPGADALRARAESVINIDSFDPAVVLGYFGALPPRSPAGRLRHALALQAGALPDAANAAARSAWTGGLADEVEEARLLSRFSGALTAEDEAERMDRLLWSDQTNAAARQLPRVPDQQRTRFAARLALRTNAPDAAQLAALAEAKHPGLDRHDAGYIYDKALWYRASGLAGSAQGLLASTRALDRAPTAPAAWLKLLLDNARAATKVGNHQNALAIASQVDDAVPPGTILRDQSLRVRDDYTSLTWLGGTIALNQTGQPAEAARLFRLYGEAARSAPTRSKGFYWAGLAATRAGMPEDAAQHFADAVQYFDQFYGQLARERLAMPQPRASEPTLAAVTPADRDAFQNHRLVQAAIALDGRGNWKERSQFLRAITQMVRSEAEHQLASQLSAQIGRRDLGVMIGRSAQANGLGAIAVGGFPRHPVPAGHMSNWTFIHAITRQESQFDPRAVSQAGARGLMQLMPGTAREVAGKLGMGYRSDDLIDDAGYNMTLGSTYFQQMLRYFNGSYPLAVAAYNAGPGNVNRWLRVNGDPRTDAVDIVAWIEAIPIFETRNYVQRVLENAVVYDTLHPDEGHAVPANPLSFYLGKVTPG